MRGRLYPMLTIGRALLERGHRVTAVAHESSCEMIEASGIEVLQADRDYPNPETRFPNETGLFNQLGTKLIRRLPGAIVKTMPGVGTYSDAFNGYYDRIVGFHLEVVRPLLADLGPDLLIGSDTSFASSTIGELLGIPVVSCCTGIPISIDPSHPPDFTVWQEGRNGLSRLKNRLGNRVRRSVERPLLARLNQFRRSQGMSTYRGLHQTISSEGCLCQLPRGFDMPLRAGQPPYFYTGPTLDLNSREDTPFPWDQLDGRPLVYASTGTVYDAEAYFSAIAEACADLPVQLVITRGGGENPKPGSLPGDPLVVDYAPQLEVIKRAAIVITHGSANTTLESFRSGVPVISIPQAFDQFGTGVRAERSGAAICLPPNRRGPGDVARAVQSMLDDQSYRDRAQEFSTRFKEDDPIVASVRVVESALSGAGHPRQVDREPHEFSVQAEDGVMLRGMRWPGDRNGSLRGTVLCLHGLSSDVNSMELLARELSAAGLDVVAADYRGHGLSGASSGRRMNVGQFARDAISICNSLDLSRIWLMSQSLGGRVGVAMMKNKPEQLTIDGFFAFAPPWRLRRASIKRLPGTVRSSFRLLRTMAKSTGYRSGRVPSRQPYTSMYDMPDFHMPVMIDEVKSLSWRRYARLFLAMRFDDFRPDGGWSLQSPCPIHVYAARKDRYVNNRDIEEVVKHAGLNLHWIECRHVSLMTNREHAQSVTDSMCDVIGGSATH